MLLILKDQSYIGTCCTFRRDLGLENMKHMNRKYHLQRAFIKIWYVLLFLSKKKSHRKTSHWSHSVVGVFQQKQSEEFALERISSSLTRNDCHLQALAQSTGSSQNVQYNHDNNLLKVGKANTILQTRIILLNYA